MGGGGGEGVGWIPTACCTLAGCADWFIFMLFLRGEGGVCDVCFALVLPHLHHVFAELF